MNASVAVVIVGDEKNISLSWTTDFPPVLLTDEVSVGDDQHDKCNNFGRVANRGRLHHVMRRASPMLMNGCSSVLVLSLIFSFFFYFCSAYLRGRSPKFINSVRNLVPLPPKKLEAQKHHNLGQISDNFPTWSQMSPERNKITCTENGVATAIFPAHAYSIWWTVVHKRRKIGPGY